MNQFDVIKNDVKCSCEESSIAGFFRSFLRSYGIPNATLLLLMNFTMCLLTTRAVWENWSEFLWTQQMLIFWQ